MFRFLESNQNNQSRQTKEENHYETTIPYQQGYVKVVMEKLSDGYLVYAKREVGINRTDFKKVADIQLFLQKGKSKEEAEEYYKKLVKKYRKGINILQVIRLQLSIIFKRVQIFIFSCKDSLFRPI